MINAFGIFYLLQDSNSDGRRTPPDFMLSGPANLTDKHSNSTSHESDTGFDGEEHSPRDSDDGEGYTGNGCSVEALEQQRKQRLQRNREAAQQCRKRKKEYVKG